MFLSTTTNVDHFYVININDCETKNVVCAYENDPVSYLYFL